ncbi:MAG: hypothetical protein ABL984_17665 [Pyrinomonadaceae bacterium]
MTLKLLTRLHFGIQRDLLPALEEVTGPLGDKDKSFVKVCELLSLEKQVEACGWKGNEGQYRIRIMDNTKGTDCTYPGIELLPDGTFVTTTYGHWTEGELAYVVSVRFTLKELDAKVK